MKTWLDIEHDFANVEDDDLNARQLLERAFKVSNPNRDSIAGQTCLSLNVLSLDNSNCGHLMILPYHADVNMLL